MRPYLLLMAVVLMAVAAFGQQPIPYPVYGPCYYGYYGCGPLIPRVTAPEVSLQQFSPNPVGASNATTGLIAGATNSTLSQMQGSTSSIYTVAVWEQGGGDPLITPDVRLWPETIGREGHIVRGAMHDGMLEPRMREERSPEERFREERAREVRSREERGTRQSEEPRGDWTFITSPSPSGAHVYGNDDVTRQNDKNGAVKYDGKTEKM